jgi:hypothetical protein
LYSFFLLIEDFQFAQLKEKEPVKKHSKTEGLTLTARDRLRARLLWAKSGGYL